MALARQWSKGCKWCEETMRDAAEMNHLHILKWARAQISPCPWDEEVCALAAKEGNLEVLKWLRAQNPPCPWNERTPRVRASIDLGRLSIACHRQRSSTEKPVPTAFCSAREALGE